MGGRGSSSGAGKSSSAKSKSTSPSIKGVEGVVFSEYTSVASQSDNTLWAESTSVPHALVKIGGGSVNVTGEKKDKFGLLKNLDSAIVHLNGIDPGNYTDREVKRLNSSLNSIRNMGFETTKINASWSSTIVAVKKRG